jgi:hypothetical protein
MRHVILTCRNHPNLRWSTKEIAMSNGKYNGLRNIFFNGTPTGKGMLSDGSGLDCTAYAFDEETGTFIHECDCPSSDLIVAPEDSLVTR